MIIQMRKHIKGKTFKLILWIILAAMAGVFSLPEIFKWFGSRDEWIVRINSGYISHNDYIRNKRFQENRINAFRAQYGQYADMILQSMGIPDPKSMAFDSLINEELLNQISQKLGIQLSSEYVAQQLQDPEFIQKNLADLIPSYAITQYGIDMRALKTHMQRAGISAGEFEERVTQALRRQLAVELIAGAVHVPEFEIKERFIQNHLAKKFSILSLPFSNFLKQEQAKPLTEQEVRAFFDKHNAQSKRYWIGEKRSGIIWEFKPEDYGITVSDERIKSYYDDFKARKFIEEPAKVQIRKIVFTVTNDQDRAKILEKARNIQQEVMQEPARFATFASKVSQDEESAKQGGLVPFFERGTQEIVIDKAAFLLKNDGDISDVLTTEDGFAIVQRIAKKKPTYKSLKSVRNEIKNTLINRRFSDRFSSETRGLLSSDELSEKTLENFARKKDGTMKALDALENDGSQVADVLFKLKEGKGSSYIDDQKGFMVLLTKVSRSYLPSLESIKTTVENDIYEERAAQKLHESLKEIRKEALAGVSLADLSKKFDGKLDHTSWIQRDKPDSLKQLEKRGITPERVLGMSRPGALIAAASQEDGYLVRLDEIEERDQAFYESKKREVRSELERERMGFFKEGFVASLYRNATIETNDVLLNFDQISEE